jgi:O-antigen/teichoic acid export membrane protein
MWRRLQRLHEGHTLLSRIFRGGAWLGAGSAAEQSLRFARNMVLTRILAPEALGLMAIVLSINSLFQVITGMWLKESVVQNPRGAERSFLNGVWFLAMGRAMALFAAAFVLAPSVASFYADPRLTVLVRLAFVSVLFQGAISPAAFVALKQMRYCKWVAVQQGGGALGVLVTIGLALHMKGVIALVVGYVAESFFRCVLSYVFFPFRPRAKFDRDDTSAMLRFSTGMLGMPLLMLVYTEGSTFLTGKLCTKEQLGLFAMTLSLARIPGLFGGVMVDLLLPSFAEMQTNKNRLNQGLLKVTSALALPALPAAVAVAVCGGQFLGLVYGEAYSAAALPLLLLFCNELLLACNIPIASLYVALGETARLRRFSLLRAAVLVVGLYPAIKSFGLVGASAMPLAAMLIAFLFQLRQLHQLTGLQLNDYFSVFVRGAVIALPLILGVVVVDLLPVQHSLNAIITLKAVIILALYSVLGLFTVRSGALKRFLWPYARKVQAT